MSWLFFFFQAEDGIRDLVRSRGLGDVYKRQTFILLLGDEKRLSAKKCFLIFSSFFLTFPQLLSLCLLYTSDAADERSSVDLGGRRIIKKKTRLEHGDIGSRTTKETDLQN